MKKIICIIEDVVSKNISPLILAATPQEAERYFAAAIKDMPHHREDFSLFMLGLYDTEEMRIVDAFESPNLLKTGDKIDASSFSSVPADRDLLKERKSE